MAKFVEMDERTKFKDQTDEKIGGPVILINKFNVHPDKVQISYMWSHGNLDLLLESNLSLVPSNTNKFL